ncbi:LOW QUALITY PROTEIN: uncharacterized GPI-anchored protein At4g28100-like [Asparagus officinalis]|uniref:LOW QUALITY PROTEIN: uncharacterized GPI-anchored protein At4g28100-like n=1 Tax=Asparagus officinalis TaxID=4686 RepID=UPI00098E2E00|nr:LOW QUALITY PROTEIN: uncharacterized GPI-anchored protein At4g28100-like [Asparagus officinalis]
MLATPLPVVKDLEKDCRNSSYAGCTRCLQSLEKVSGSIINTESTTIERPRCSPRLQLMGLTWLLAKNKTLYIPTVSAVLRAVLYSSHPPTQPYKCSPDQEKMPLAVDSLVIQKTESSSSAVASSDFALGLWVYYVHVVVALFLCFGGTVVDVVA